MDYRVMPLDPRSVTPVDITFADDALTINLPQRTYNSGCPYFMRLDENIPAETTIGANVVITIGTGTVEYPLLDRAGAQVTAERLRAGYRYPIELIESAPNGAFKLKAPLRYSCYKAVFSVDGTVPAEGGADA